MDTSSYRLCTRVRQWSVLYRRGCLFRVAVGCTCAGQERRCQRWWVSFTIFSQDLMCRNPGVRQRSTRQQSRSFHFEYHPLHTVETAALNITHSINITSAEATYVVGPTSQLDCQHSHVAATHSYSAKHAYPLNNLSPLSKSARVNCV